MKPIRSLALLLLILCPFILAGCKKGESPVAPPAQGGDPPLQTETVTYTVENDEVTITGARAPSSEILIIPETIAGHPVTTIAAHAFKMDSVLRFVVLPETITAIGDSAFEGTWLTAIWLPSVLPEIGERTFPYATTFYAPYLEGTIPAEYAAALPTAKALPFDIPEANTISNYRGTEAFAYIPPEVNGEAITAIANGSFSEAAFSSVRATLTSVYAPGITNIGNYAFYQCIGLAHATFSTVTVIGTEAFAFSGLLNADFPLITGAVYAFRGCTNLQNVNMPRITAIAQSGFYDCQNLTNITLGEITSVPNFAFTRCYKLVNADFPSVTTIGYQSFNNCSNLKSARMPLTTMIDRYAFSGCSSLTEANFPLVTILADSPFGGCASLTNASFPSLATTLLSYAFAGCTNLRTVNLPAVTSIGNNAFQNCERLIAIHAPLVMTVGANAFYNATALKNVNFPLLTSASNSAFSNCHALTNAAFGMLGSIGDYAFANCQTLQTLTIRKTAPPSVGTGAFANTPTNKTLYVFPDALSAYSDWKTLYEFTSVSQIE